ncbi:MAG: NYN domain-containing protein [Dehalococcoidia bacterium]|nr:NYN domain-containing protein [Dehalococcoidia bacterium]
MTVFIDAQNTYKGARECFFGSPVHYVSGQFDPVRLGNLLAARGGPKGAPCVLEQVRVYTGRPNSTKAPQTYGAHMKQCTAWEKQGAMVVWRPLRYPRDWPNRPAEEKGIDVALSIDFISLTLDGAYDVGVLVSTDTDLLPALEFVLDRFAGSPAPATAAWRGISARRRLAVQGKNLWCHWLRQEDYDAVADPTDYNQ